MTVVECFNESKNKMFFQFQFLSEYKKLDKHLDKSLIKKGKNVS